MSEEKSFAAGTGRERNTAGPWRVKEYGEYRRVTPPTVYNWITKGWLNSVKIGGCRFILPEHDSAFIERFNSVEG